MTDAGIQVRWTRSADELLPHREAWEALSQNAAEPNVFYEPWLFLPSLARYAQGQQIRVALVYRGARMIGFFPIASQPGFRGVPWPSAELWMHEHCYLCTPLIDASHVRDCIDALLTAYPDAREMPRLLSWNWIGGDGPIHRELISLIRERRLRHTASPFNRAVFTRRLASAEQHLSQAISGKHRREFGRLEKRLHDLGAYSYQVCPADASTETVSAWIQEFLDLEASGWKGAQGTALLCSERDSVFFRDAVLGAHRLGRLNFIAARLDGRAIAMKCEFSTGHSAFSFKIAYSEDLKKYCPGIQLQIWHTSELFNGPVDWVDSCASSSQSMIDRIWPDSRIIDRVTIAFRPVPEGLLLKTIPWLAERIKRLRGHAAANVGHS